MSELLPTHSKADPTSPGEPSVLAGLSRTNPGPSPIPGMPNIPIWRFVLAFLIAVVADIVLILAAPFEPILLSLDIFTALLLCATLGFNWIFVPTLLVEAVPGLEVFPTWTLVVLALCGIKLARKT